MVRKEIAVNHVIDHETVVVNHAGSKARLDANGILERLGFAVHTLHCSQDLSPLSVARDLVSVSRQVKKILRSFNPGDLYVIQFPFRCYSVRLAQQMREISRRDRVTSVVLVHDLISLYHIGEKDFAPGSRFRNEEQTLACFDYVIAHNAAMKRYLVSKGLDENKIIELGLFDYLVPHPEAQPAPRFERTLFVAGNLEPAKAGYLRELQGVEGKRYEVNLFGNGWDGEQNRNGVAYQGSFPPEEMPRYINRGFGLIWDGDTVDGCSGEFGTYLRFNCPHKCSAYLACGVPVITWREAAIAPFIEREGIGLCVSSLMDIGAVLDRVTPDSYAHMAENVRRIRKRLVAGSYLEDALAAIREDVGRA